jgi:hypothetical protein
MMCYEMMYWGLLCCLPLAKPCLLVQANLAAVLLASAPTNCFAFHAELQGRGGAAKSSVLAFDRGHRPPQREQK